MLWEILNLGFLFWYAAALQSFQPLFLHFVPSSPSATLVGGAVPQFTKVPTVYLSATPNGVRHMGVCGTQQLLYLNILYT